MAARTWRSSDSSYWRTDDGATRLDWDQRSAYQPLLQGKEETVNYKRKSEQFSRGSRFIETAVLKQEKMKQC